MSARGGLVAIVIGVAGGLGVSVALPSVPPAPPRDVARAITKEWGRDDRPAAFAVARCESTYNIRAVSPGGTYRGLWQFSMRTWRGLGGRGDPAAQTAAYQTKIARRLWVQSGRTFSRHWPVCGRGR